MTVNQAAWYILTTLYNKSVSITIQWQAQGLGIILECRILLGSVGEAAEFKGTVENSVSAESDHRLSFEMCVLNGCLVDEYVIGTFENLAIECVISCEINGVIILSNRKQEFACGKDIQQFIMAK